MIRETFLRACITRVFGYALLCIDFSGEREQRGFSLYWIGKLATCNPFFLLSFFNRQKLSTQKNLALEGKVGKKKSNKSFVTKF